MSSPEHHGFHIVPVKTLAAVGTALLVLTLVTVWAASLDFGKLNVWIALAIATVKASLVVAIFMHLNYDRPFHTIVFVVSVSFVALFISFSLTDTHEYAPDVDHGNAPEVVKKLTELESTAADSSHEP